MAKPRRRRRQVEVEPVVWEHPGKDRSDRFAVDALIREAGYRIFRRAKVTLWIRNGKVRSQDSILTELDGTKLWNAEHQEYLYWEGVPSFIDLSGGPDLE